MILEVHVKPNSSTSTFLQDESGIYRATLKSPPVDGKANAELIGLVAKHFHCAKSLVTIKTGGRGRTKLLQLPDHVVTPAK